MRHSQGTHKIRQRERAVVGGRRGLTKVPQSRNCQKRWRRKAQGGPPKGWISKTAPNEPGHGIAALESGSCAHKRRRVRLGPPEKIGAWRHVGDCLSTGFPLTGRSASCASESEVAGWRRACWKSWLEKVTDGSGGGEEIKGQSGGFRKEKKVTGRKHNHRKKNWIFPFGSDAMWKEKKGESLIYYLQKQTILHIGIYIYIHARETHNT